MANALCVAATAAIAALLAASGCSPRAQAPVQTASAPASSGQAAPIAGGSSTLPAACQTLLASMQSCSDNLNRSGSPLGQQIRFSMIDMRNSIASAPPADVATFCDTEASAFAQRTQAAHC
jgi:hypothetical protein